MKKLMIASAVCAAAFCLQAVESSVVGYVTSTVAASANKTFAVTLTDCADPTAGVRIDELFTNTDFSGGSWGAADEIWRWDTSVNKWAKYFYEKTGRGKDVTYAWKKYNYSAGTVEALTDADKVDPGQTFLFRRADGTETITLTLSGQVQEFSTTASYTINASCNIFMAYSWPVEIKISNFMNLATFTSSVSGGSWGAADEIWRWDASVGKWAKYFYEKTGRGKDVTYAWKKYNYSAGTVEELTDNDKILAGEGFLYRRADGTDSITITWKALSE